MASPAQHVSQEVTLTERSTQRVLRARIVPATVEHLVVHESSWRPALRIAKALDAEWDWYGDFVREELPSDRYETYAVVLDGESEPQALMSLLISEAGVYVERLASSPENRSGGRLKSTGTFTRFGGRPRSALAALSRCTPSKMRRRSGTTATPSGW